MVIESNIQCMGWRKVILDEAKLSLMSLFRVSELQKKLYIERARIQHLLYYILPCIQFKYNLIILMADCEHSTHRMNTWYTTMDVNVYVCRFNLQKAPATNTLLNGSIIDGNATKIIFSNF